MGTTTLRIAPELKARIDRVAAATGTTAHALMLEGLLESLECMEERLAFDAEVDRRWRELLRSGEHCTLDDLRAYAVSRSRGESAEQPVSRSLAAVDLAGLHGADRVRRRR